MHCCSRLTAPQPLCQQMSQRRHLSQQHLLYNGLLWSCWWTVEFFEQLFPIVTHCTLSAVLPWYQPPPLGTVLTCPLTSKGFVLLSGSPHVTSCIPEPHTENHSLTSPLFDLFIMCNSLSSAVTMLTFISLISGSGGPTVVLAVLFYLLFISLSKQRCVR